jgi:PAS domain S-box-containing protein
MVTPDGQIRYTYISDGAKDLFGVSPEEIISDPTALFDCHGPQYRETFRERLLEASRELKMWDVEATIITKNGDQKYTHAIARPHRTPDGTVFWDGVILDATKIKEAELEAASIEGRTREAILESISQGLAIYDEDDKLVVCNSHFLELNPELGGVIQPGVSYETVARALIDSGLDAEASSSHRDELFQQQMQLHRSGGNAVERCLPNGRWVLITEHRTGHGGTAIVHTDVTELKKREAKLERSNHELQQFASVASHDLQEPLRKIEAFGDRLHNLCGNSLGEEATLYLDRMLSSTKRMRKLINDLLAYSRVTTKSRPFEACNFRAITGEVVSDLQIQIEESGGRVEIGDLPVIEADAMQMRQLVQNLISNALKFCRKDVPPVVTVSGRLVSGGNRPVGQVSHSGDLLELSVSDNGIGFDMKYVERIFNIFQRLHNRSEYEGTGIGLATCRKIVERHGGALRATSKPGQGTTITAILPAKQMLTEA